ncbi:MAG: DUF2309 domain-containing protein [Methylococcaceae bacterium]|nr:DUF2309 domain-containing protein [Methylococcaceae bacterium]
MQAADHKHNRNTQTLRDHIVAALHELDHVLPGQAPLHDFVHHNTLHGFQHLPFEEALDKFAALTGIFGYQPEENSRSFYWQGRINDDDLSAALAGNPGLQTEQIVCVLKDRPITRMDIYRMALLYDLSEITPGQFNWQIDELNALNTVQNDVPKPVRNQFLASQLPENDAIQALWNRILVLLDLHQINLHPETLLDLSMEQAEDWLAHALPNNDMELRRLFGASVRQHNLQQARLDLDEQINQLGDNLTLRSFIAGLSGIDVLDAVRPQLIRQCSSALDEAVAAWQTPGRSQLGFYASWRVTMIYDANPFLHELPDWLQIITELPSDPIDTIILQLSQLEIPENKWPGYLRRLALELPGWSGLINWREQHPKYQASNDAAPKLADYLAIRLTLDRLWLNQVCRDIWKIEATPHALHAYFRKNLPEFIVRRSLYQRNLPEYLTELAESLSAQTSTDRHNRQAWQELADLIWTWQLSPMTDNNEGLSIFNAGWRLFRLFQHLGLSAEYLQQSSRDDLVKILDILNTFNETERGKVWLNAYELHYRDAFFHALSANSNKGRWARREKRPSSQIIFCMDDREESFRRHLEELNPTIETLGAAGFFGVAMNYQGLDDPHSTPLCPVVVTPAHTIHEAPQMGSETTLSRHKLGRSVLMQGANRVYHGLRRNLLSSYLINHLLAPFALTGLVSKSLFPLTHQRLMSHLSDLISPCVKTQLQFTSTDHSRTATPDLPKQGFTDSEQVDRVAGFLRNIGLTDGFAPLVVLMGHGSISQNNPHLAAYDCGACSGRHGGPNARIFAAMANRPEIRSLLTARGISIPPDTWFIGSEHNTCNENIIWYDLDALPASHQAGFNILLNELAHVRKMSAHERCRRLASAPVNPSPELALAHIEERAADFSQARPELGHATNASAIVGRRSLSQGIFFDRRVFLISYDPAQDTEGTILESILLAVGPVGAGINLEYYFSTVNNERFGCGSKVTHNITGFFGVMEGSSSDLRTGLPRQMVEIHEAMRLQILVEAKTSTLENIYQRQESLRELIAGGWILLSTKDPDTGKIYSFERGTGFVLWHAKDNDLASFANSADCYRGQSLPVPPALIKQPEVLEP